MEPWTSFYGLGFDVQRNCLHRRAAGASILVRAKRMKKHFIAWVSSLLFLLVLGGVQSVYRLTSLLCMARAEPAYQYVWLPRIYIWCAISLSLGLAWVALLLLLVRQERKAD